MSTLLLKPAIDDRDPKADHIVSRIGLNARANIFDGKTDLEDHILTVHTEKKIDCVFLDEAQFLTRDQVWQLSRVADYHRIPIMCFGLRTDFQGELFPGSATLLAIADDIRELRTLCWCGRKATMTMRVDEAGGAITEGEQIDVGGNNKYISLCRKHWSEKKLRTV